MKPAEEVHAGPVILRRWTADMEANLAAEVRASLPELQPFMTWARDGYGVEHARDFIAAAAGEWDEEVAFNYAVLTPSQEVAGSAGLMTRLGPGAMEIGYWISSAHTGQGFATAVAVALSRTALTMNGIDQVTIRHDAANAASRRVAEKAGFTEVACRPSTLEQAPGNCGFDIFWELRHPCASAP